MSILINIPRKIVESPTAPKENLFFMRNIYDFFKSKNEQVDLSFIENENIILNNYKYKRFYLYHYISYDDNLPVKTIKVSSIKNFYWVDSLGYSKFSNFFKNINNHEDMIHEVNPGKASGYCRYLASMLSRNNFSKYQQPEQKKLLKNERKIVFIPLQVPGDQVLQNECSLIEFLDTSIKSIKSIDESIRIIVKIHPKCIDESLTKHCFKRERENLIEIHNESIHSIFLICDFVITLNSGVGMEAMLQGIPVYGIGKSEYQKFCAGNKLGFNVLSLNESDKRILIEQQYQFVYYLLNRILVHKDFVNDYLVKTTS